MLAIGWRTLADVNSYIKDGIFDTSNELRLGEWWCLEMEASHDAVRGHRLVVLYELEAMTQDWGYSFVEISLGETFKEVASGILEHSWFYYHYAINSGFYYVEHI